MSLRTETSSYNMRYILHLINIYVIEDVPFCPGLVGTVVKLIQDKILTMQLPADVTLVAFDVLMDFVDLYDFVKRDSKNVARELVLALSRYVDTLIGAGKLVQTYPLIVQAYDCMIKWILVSQWIIDDRDCYKAVIATLSKGITIFDRDSHASSYAAAASTESANSNTDKKKRRDTSFQPTKQLFQLPPRVNKHTNAHHHHQDHQSATNSTSTTRNNSGVHKKEEMAVRMAAEYCMSQFVNHLGRFCLPNEHALGGCRSAMVDDVLQLKKLRELQKQQDGTLVDHSSIRYFLIDKKTLLALIDVTDKVPKRSKNTPEHIPSIVAVIRDTTGKYVWSMDTQYKDPTPPMITAAVPVESPLSLIISTTTTAANTQANSTTNASGFLKPPSATTISNQDYFEQQQQQKRNEKPVTVPTAVAVNEREMPSMNKVFLPQSEEWKQWEVVKTLMKRQESESKNRSNNNKENPLNGHNYQMAPTGPNIDMNSPRGFRLLLSQIGLLLPRNRNHITPLHITDSVISEMETLDMLNE